MSLIVRGPGRPQAYVNMQGHRIPGVTTITGSRKTGVEALMIWSNREGLEGRDHRETRDRAASAGQMAHNMVENAIHKRDPWEGIPESPPEIRQQAQGGFEAWEQWSRVMNVDYKATETPMISELYQYGGTPDAIGIVDGKLSLIDWKTSNAVYGDYIVQMAAYRHLWEENHDGDVITACYLLRFGKDMGDYHVHSYPQEVMNLGWVAFLHLRELYDLDKQLRKVAS